MNKWVIVAVLSAAVLLPGKILYAAESADAMRVRIVAGGFKGFAEAVLAVTDLEKEKKKFVDRIEAVGEEEFEFQYERYWRLIKELPLPIRLRYGISERMTRQQLTGQIRSLTKNDVHAIIQSVPDDVIAREFDRRLQRMGKQLRQAPLPQQVQEVWEKVNSRFRDVKPAKEH